MTWIDVFTDLQGRPLMDCRMSSMRKPERLAALPASNDVMTTLPPTVFKTTPYCLSFFSRWMRTLFSKATASRTPVIVTLHREQRASNLIWFSKHWQHTSCLHGAILVRIDSLQQIGHMVVIV